MLQTQSIASSQPGLNTNDNLNCQIYSTIQQAMKYGCMTFYSSLLSQIMFHPLDLLKVRFQSIFIFTIYIYLFNYGLIYMRFKIYHLLLHYTINRNYRAIHILNIDFCFLGHDGKSKNLVPKYNGIVDGLKQIIQQEGLNGLFKGCLLSILSQSLARVSFITVYEIRKIQNQQQIENKNLVVIKSSTESSLFTLLFINPMFVIKNRLILSVENKNSIRSVVENVMEIRKNHNIQGFYRGFSLSLALGTHGVILMYSYETLKEKMLEYDHFLSINSQPLVCGLLSKLIASCLLFPLTTLRTRIQQNQYAFIDNQKILRVEQIQKYAGINDCFKKILKDEGIKGFYKGLSPSLLKSVPSKGLFFYFYELLKAQSSQNQF